MSHYSYWDIKHIYSQCDIELVKMVLYKCKTPRYQLVKKTTGEIISSYVTLNQLRELLNELGI